MTRRMMTAVVAVWLVVIGVSPQGQDATGWKIPAGAEKEKNPFPTNAAQLAAGQKLFATKCLRCHGERGEGDGPAADVDLKKAMDLTRADRAAANPDGVVFYKVWSGRPEPRMPAFEDQLTKEQTCAVVAFTQTLRAKK